MKKILLPCLAVMAIFYSCHKDNTTPCVTSMASVAGTYKLTSLRFKPSGGNESDIIASLPTCRRDDLHVLNANGSYNYQDAGTICSPNGSFAGDWALSGTTVTLEGEVYTLQSFDCTTLVVYKNNYPSAGDKTTSIFTRQ